MNGTGVPLSSTDLAQLARSGPILAIESSCDETAAAILDQEGQILSDVIHTQVAAHAPYGGVVPEIASREHLVKVHEVVSHALAQAEIQPTDLKAVCATYGPGLIGALLVGLQVGKAMAHSLSIPFVGVHHIEGHLMAASVDPAAPPPPFIGLVASGGHSALYHFTAPGCAGLLGETRDDAAGEAFDKTAKLLGLGYPGGKVIDELSEGGDPLRFELPISLKDRRSYDFSFSGLKTAIRLLIERLRAEGTPIEGQLLHDLCASVRRAVGEALIRKALLACRQKQVSQLVLGGGVTANSWLREESVKRGKELGIEVYVPPRRLCTDNAVMIALAGRAHLLAGRQSRLDLNANPGARVEDSLEAFAPSPTA